MRNKHFGRLTFRLLTRLTAVCLIALALPAQTSMARAYRIFRTVTATSNCITIRQPTANGAPLQFTGGWVSLPLGGTELLTTGGTLSSGSAGTIQKLDKRAPAATATATLDGTVGGSPDTIISVPIAANGAQPLAGGQYLPFTPGSPDQITLCGSGASQAISVYMTWVEPKVNGQ